MKYSNCLPRNYLRVNDRSIGMVKNMLEEYKRPEQDETDNWRTEFESWCKKGVFEYPELSRTPRLIGAKRAKRKSAEAEGIV